MNIIRLQGEIEKRNGIYYEYDTDAIPLGEGGMGRVFKGFRVIERTGEKMPVAIKAIYENIPEHVVERARREANIQLENDNLIRMYGFVETTFQTESGGKVKVHYHVIMELLVGVTLENVMNGITCDQNGMQIPFAAEIYSQYLQNRDAAVVRIMKPILSGLMALHDKGYIHRDIDPSNIMITIDGKIKLIDFGICKQIVSLGSVDKALTATGVFMGKVNYAAPELVLGDVKNQSYTTDIYALGVLLYQLCTGHLPFTGTDQDVLSANLRDPLPMKDVRNVALKRIIRKATDKIQSKRYASVAEFRVDLEHVLTNGNKKNRKLVPFMIGFACVVVALIGVACFLFYNESEKEVAKPTLRQPTCVEMYNQALSFLNQKDSIELQTKGKELLRILVEDSLFAPAKVDYYVNLLNSNNSSEVNSGFAGLCQIIQEDTLNSIALFECGLTLSKGNRFFNVPTVRQSFLNIEADLDKANDWLFKAMEIDTADYKSVYWAFNNLMEKKIAGDLPASGDKLITKLYEMFIKRAKESNDVATDIYINAIKSDTETLKAWGLLK
ncbi:serine/threonine protein kinase [Phocaeicola sp. Sa1CVN1]|uniref:non-specific serine/threonine protein kinase n=1 Tax=Phocaeicola intestinalis TaxID=2762212 RepID=A0ABR8Y6W5_9BACT|nr:serine/threonine-protein kinase [Phocaeicola intestinalis]MBD8039951.1 serine/threonine protein kinase [Phocaeicola intestinalis]